MDNWKAPEEDAYQVLNSIHRRNVLLGPVEYAVCELNAAEHEGRRRPSALEFAVKLEPRSVPSAVRAKQKLGKLLVEECLKDNSD